MAHDYRGHVERGVVILDDGPELADGTVVTVRIEAWGEQPAGRRLEELAGTAQLPQDIAEKHDDYRRTRAVG